MKFLKTIMFLTTAVTGFQLADNQANNNFNDSQLQDIFNKYQLLNRKQYFSPEEQNYRFEIFKENAKFLLGDFNDIQNKIKYKQKDGQTKMVVANNNPCQEELALNDFMDFSNQEFSNNYLLQPDFFNPEIYQTVDEIYQPGEDEFDGFSFHQNQNWISNEIDSVLQDPNFNIFDETLKFRQNRLEIYDLNHDFQDYQMNNDLLGFTKHDQDYYQQQIKMFLFDQMPDYNIDWSQQENKQDPDQEDLILQEECQRYMEQQYQGRRLQYQRFNFDSFWNKYSNQLNTQIDNNIKKSNLNVLNDNSKNNLQKQQKKEIIINNQQQKIIQQNQDQQQIINKQQFEQKTQKQNFKTVQNFQNIQNQNQRQQQKIQKPVQQIIKKNTNNNKLKQRQNQQKKEDDFIINDSTKVYKTNSNPPKYIAMTNGKVKIFDYNPKQKLREEKQRKQRLIAQIKQILQRKQQKKQKQQQSQNYYQQQRQIQQQKLRQQQLLKQQQQQKLQQQQQQKNLQQQSQQKQQKKSQQKQQQNKNTVVIEGVELPKYVNWQEKAKFTPIKNQYKCNACYAFGAISTLETHISLKYNKQIILSEQEILDCSPGNQSCDGGQPYLVYDYIKKNGVNLQKDYRYIARKQQCKRKLDRYRFDKIKGRIFVKPGIINLLKAVNFGPVAVVSHASDFMKYFYDGTFTGRGCYNKKTPNHASMLYGYNLDAPQPYLLFKNNWGQGWGNRGYYKVTIGELSNSNLGHCLIAETTFNVIPIL